MTKNAMSIYPAQRPMECGGQDDDWEVCPDPAGKGRGWTATRELEDARGPLEEWIGEFWPTAAAARAGVAEAVRLEPAPRTEMWEAWIDGDREGAVRFDVPVGGTCDIADAGAAALGVDVSEALNVARI